MAQKLFLMADTSLDSKLRAGNNRLTTLLAKHKDDKEALEELFLATVSRKPSADEVALFMESRQKQSSRQAAFTGALWALINTTEFIFNH